ncbi:hypothetical protein, partial [Enterobacter hormaechei]
TRLISRFSAYAEAFHSR